MKLFEKTLGQVLEEQVERFPSKEFLVYSDRDLRFTYKEFNERVDKLALGLLQTGMKPGDKLGIWANNVPDWITFMFATAKIGAVLVTINTNYKSHELEYLIKNSDLHTLAVIDSYRDSDYISMIYDLVPELKTNPRGRLNSTKFPELKNVVLINPEKYRGMYNTQELLLLGEQEDINTLKKVQKGLSAHDTVNMQYTSGTTGFPKGVMLSHYNILNNGYTVGQCMQFTEDEKLLTCVPMFHCFGCVLALCAIVTHGGTMVMAENFDPILVLASIQKEKCTALYGVPTMFIAELNHPMFSQFDISSLRTGIMAGALCPIEVMKEVMKEMHMKNIIIVYGLTESSPGMTATTIHDDPEIRATTVGKALPNVEVKIIDPESGESLCANKQGEVCCKGYNVMKGYYKNHEATTKAIDSQGWLHSGDLGRMDENGYLQITGRIKDMIIRGGENIYPREIENFIHQHPAVECVEVVGIPSKKYGESIGAFIKIKSGESLSEADIYEYCRGKIARFKIPKYLFFIDTYPMTASGKIQKYKLKDIGLCMLKKQGVEVV
ncbi:AMP-binding protein [Halosquirtibacter laminarini]|uniref:AMP-binding protein n=1 Tax=Halosquirtibacter laminarini TaxID=3374600 RepID=A0AC61NN01_9BACT|nr:AMP-binding protein [Prolixibacteraceae bacterium]